MNETIFIIHIVIIILFLLLALRLGKNYLLILIALQAVVANLFVIKQIELFGKTVTCTDVFIVGSFLGTNILQEYFGKEVAKKAIKISFFSMVFFLVMSKIHLLYTPSKFDVANQSFISILSNSPRIIISSILVFFITQRMDVIFFGFLKKIFNDRHFVLRITLSSITAQLIDTVLFTLFALKGLVSSVIDVMILSFSIKSLVILFSTPFTKLSKFMVKKISYE
jgi:queuosine precursor transporter